MGLQWWGAEPKAPPGAAVSRLADSQDRTVRGIPCTPKHLAKCTSPAVVLMYGFGPGGRPMGDCGLIVGLAFEKGQDP